MKALLGFIAVLLSISIVHGLWKRLSQQQPLPPPAQPDPPIPQPVAAKHRVIDRSQLEADIVANYYQSCSGRIVQSYLARLLVVLSSLQERCTDEAYEFYVSLCTQALVGFTAASAPFMLAPQSFAGPLRIRHKLRDLIIEHEDGFRTESSMGDAFRALADPFRNNFLSCRELSLFDWRRTSPKDKCTASDLEIAVSGSPLFQRRFELIPQEEIVENPFEFSEDKRFEGMWIVAGHDRGKLNLLCNLIEADRGKNVPVIVIDTTGELIDCYRDRASIIEPSPIHPPRIDVAAPGSEDQTLAVIEDALGEVFDDDLRKLWRQSAILAAAIPGANLDTISNILQLRYIADDPVIARRVDELSGDADRKFFRHDFKDQTYQKCKAELTHRLAQLTQNPCIKAMFDNNATAFDLAKLMDERSLIVIDNSWRDTGLGEPSPELFGRIMLSLIRSAVDKRARQRGQRQNAIYPVYLFVDQPHLFIDQVGTARQLLGLGRHQHLAVTFANQALSEISSEQVKNTLLRCGILMINPGVEAPLWARRFNLDESKVEALKNLPADAFCVLIEAVSPHGINVYVPTLSRER